MSDADFIAESFEFVVYSLPHAKNDENIKLYRHADDIKNNIHLYTFRELSLTKSDMDFNRYLIELNSSGNKQHTFIFVHDFYSLQRRKENIEKNFKDSRSIYEIEIDDNNIKKERALRLASSIQPLLPY